MTRRKAEDLLQDARQQLQIARSISSAAWEESIEKRIEKLKEIIYDIEHPPFQFGGRPHTNGKV